MFCTHRAKNILLFYNSRLIYFWCVIMGVVEGEFMGDWLGKIGLVEQKWQKMPYLSVALRVSVDIV